MIKVYVKKEIPCPVSSAKVKKELKLFLEEKGIVSNADVSVSFISKSKMKRLAKIYLNENNSVHNVLSFPFLEEKEHFVNPPGNYMHLGDIVICYPEVINQAKKEGRLIDEVVIGLIRHGALHLMGIHHD